MGRESQRVMETKIRIRDSFFDLYATKKIERISIKEITDKAQLNRATFYVYYKDIYDLLEKTENELIEELMEKVKGIVTMILRDEDIIPFLPTIEFYQRYSKILRTLFGPYGDSNFIYKIKAIIKKTLGELFRKENIPQLDNMEYVMEYISSAQIGIISFWLQNDMSLPVTELGNMIKQITLHGPVGYLKSQMNEAETVSR